MYSGELKGGSHVWNWTRGEKEGPIEVLDIKTNRLRSVFNDCIVAIRGSIRFTRSD